jgi:hypothetical protein
MKEESKNSVTLGRQTADDRAGGGFMQNIKCTGEAGRPASLGTWLEAQKQLDVLENTALLGKPGP